MYSSFRMNPKRHKDVLMVVTAAVVFGPGNQPLFRELAYSRSPNCNVGQYLERTDAWRFATPYKFNSLTDDQKQRAEDMRESCGMMFQPNAKERLLGCDEQYQVYRTMKEAWLDHKRDSDQELVVYHQKEVGQLMNTLGIPATSLYDLFQDEEAKTYDPLKDNRQFPNFNGTCGIRHYGHRPCQGLLARRLAEFVWSKEIPSKKTREEAEERQDEIIVKAGTLQKKMVYSSEDATVNLEEDRATQIPEGEHTEVFEDATEHMAANGLVLTREGKSWDQF